GSTLHPLAGRGARGRRGGADLDARRPAVAGRRGLRQAAAAPLAAAAGAADAGLHRAGVRGGGARRGGRLTGRPAASARHRRGPGMQRAPDPPPAGAERPLARALAREVLRSERRRVSLLLAIFACGLVIAALAFRLV